MYRNTKKCDVSHTSLYLMNNALIRRGYCRIFHWIHTFGGDIRNLTILLLLSLSFGTVTDIDGNIYETVLIGEQLWVAENLKVTHYRNGDEIPNNIYNEDWNDLNVGAYGYYNDDQDHLDTYGNLYNWYAVDDERGVCPEGFHVPSDDDFKELEMYLGMSESEANNTGWRGTNEGCKLAGNSALWADGNLENNSEFGMSGLTFLPAGYRSFNNGYYGIMGNGGYFWSSSENSSNDAWYRKLSYNVSSVNRNYYREQGGFSIRCLMD